jgi:tRNA pseudouridine65 synthase
VFLVHRFDRKTSGLVLVALDSKTANRLAIQFAAKTIQKTYWAICRGHLQDSIVVEKALENDNGNFQDAETAFVPLKKTTLDICSGKYPTTRLSLIQCSPKTGRTHQIRRHLGNLRHYIINDRPHGDCKVNKAFKEQLDYNHMMLHAKEIEFDHPVTNERMTLQASFFQEFTKLLKVF